MSKTASHAIPDWFQQHGDELVAFLARRLGCRHAAADLAQETYLKLYHSAPHTDIGNLSAFAYRVAANLATDHHCKQTVRARHEGSEEEAEYVPSPGATPEESLHQEQRLPRIRQALDELPPDCRTAFLANRLEGCSHAEIARRMGVSESMVAKHIEQREIGNFMGIIAQGQAPASVLQEINDREARLESLKIELERLAAASSASLDDAKLVETLRVGIGQFKALLHSDVPTARKALKTLLSGSIRCRPAVKEGRKTLELEGKTNLGALLPPGYINVASPRGLIGGGGRGVATAATVALS